MKKNLLIPLIIIVFIILAIIIFFLIKKITIDDCCQPIYDYNSEQAVNIMNPLTIQNLEDCQGWSEDLSSEQRNQYQFCSYSISDANLSKLKIIGNLKGNKLCDSTEKNYPQCGIEDYYLPYSEDIWKFSWSEIVVRNNLYSLIIFKNNNNYFYALLQVSPPRSTIYLLNPEDKVLIESLK